MALTERQEADAQIFRAGLKEYMRESPQVKLFGDKVREVGWILTQTMSLTKPAEDFDPTNLLMQTVCQ